MLNASGDVVWAGICNCRLQIKVECARGGVIGEVRMHASYLASIRIHPASGLSRFDVAPNHGGHVALVIHKAGVEVCVFVWVGGFHMDESTRKRIFLKSPSNQSKDQKNSREFALTKKWNMVKNFPGGMSMWSPNQLF